MDMKSLLKKLVETESPSHDRKAVNRMGAIGEGYHSEREFIFANSLEQKKNLLVALLKNW